MTRIGEAGRVRLQFRGLLLLVRPQMLARTVALVLMGAYFAGGSSGMRGLPLWLATASFVILWGGLYALNDFVDLPQDRLRADKRNRPLVRGDVSSTGAAAFALSLVLLGLLLTLTVSAALLVVAAAMVCSQVLYTATRGSRGADLLLVVFANPMLRLAAGSVATSGMLRLPPLLAAAAVFAAHLIGFLVRGARAARRGEGPFLRTSAALGERTICRLLVAAAIVGLCSYSLLVVNSVLRVWPSVLGTLPLRFTVLLLPGLAFVVGSYRLLHEADNQTQDLARQRGLALLAPTVALVALLLFVPLDSLIGPPF